VAALAASSSTLWIIVVTIAEGEIPASLHVVFALAFTWLYLVVIAVGVSWWWGKGYVIQVLPESLRLRTEKRVFVSVSWIDVDAIGQVPVTGLPLLWRMWAWICGWKRTRSIARIHFRRMIRQSPLGFRTTTRGFGWPGFTRTLYLAPDDVEGFVGSAQSRLRPVT
jgi:hypothetical protein